MSALKIMFVILPLIYALYLYYTMLNVYAAASSDSALNNTITNDGSKTKTESINDFINNVIDYPYQTFAYSSVINTTALVHDGIILKNVNPTELAWNSWNPTAKLVIKEFYKDNLMRLFRMEGSTGNGPGGFVSNNLDYKGRYISLIIGNVTKPTNTDFQISIVFNVTGNRGSYLLRFVNGPLFVNGWLHESYYEKIKPYSSRLIDLNNLIQDDGLILKQVSIIQSGSTSSSLEFRIDLNRTTENPPVILPGDKSYSVIGNITTPNDISYNLKNSSYIFHNLGINRLVTLELSSVADHGKLIANDWNLSNTYKWKDNKTNVNHLLLTAERQLILPKLSPDVVYKLDIYQSLSNSGSRDWLFLVLVITPLLLYWYRKTCLDYTHDTNADS